LLGLRDELVVERKQRRVIGLVRVVGLFGLVRVIGLVGIFRIDRLHLDLEVQLQLEWLLLQVPERRCGRQVREGRPDDRGLHEHRIQLLRVRRTTHG